MIVHAATDMELVPPRFGGAERAFGLLRGLAREHDVAVLTIVPQRDRGAARETVAGVRIVRRRAWYTSLHWRLERLRVGSLEAAAAGHARRAGSFARALPGTPEALLADFHLTGLFAVTEAPLKVYTAHNVEADHFAATAPPTVGRARWVARVREAEHRACDAADLVVACSDEDGARMETLHGVRPERRVVIPNGWDETRVSAPSPMRRASARAAMGLADDAYVALFLGSDVPHNRDALALLMSRVSPEAARAGIVLLVAGGVTRALGSRREPWLIARPATADLGPLLDAADVGLNPVVRGGGSNVKVPTYLGAGLAVITTPHGLRGYAALAPHVIVSAPEGFAAALATRPQGWNVRGLAVPAEVAALAWGRLGARLGEILEARRLGAVTPLREVRS